MKSVSVILPTYNEAENIIPLIVSIRKHVNGLKEILVVDDDSPDKTAQIVRTWATHHHAQHSVRVILRLTAHGLTKSISEGIQNARGSIIVWMDADFSMPPAVINKLTAEIEKGVDIAVGSRFISGGTSKKTGSAGEQWYTIWISTLANKIMRILFSLDFYDYTSGFIAVKKHVVRSLPLRGSYGEYCIDFILRAFAGGFHVVEIPYACVPRRYGISKTATTVPALFKRCYQYGMMVLRLLWETKIHRNNP